MTTARSSFSTPVRGLLRGVCGQALTSLVALAGLGNERLQVFHEQPMEHRFLRQAQGKLHMKVIDSDRR
jgi:hypothetical protein